MCNRVGQGQVKRLKDSWLESKRIRVEDCRGWEMEKLKCIRMEKNWGDGRSFIVFV